MTEEELNKNLDDIIDRAIVNFTKSIPTDVIKSNVKFEVRAGMRPRIIRSSNGNCCAWCSSLAGEYYADEAPDEIYARHDNCTCTVTYISEKGSQDAHTKAWINKEEENARRERVDGDRKYINDLKVKKMREKAERIGEAEEFSRQENAIRDIHATGTNKFNKGFTEKNLKRHFGSEGKHTYQYPGWTEDKYEQEALRLVQSRATDDIIGYKTINGAVVRYRKSTNDLVAGYPKSGIATMYKPKDDSKKGLQFVIRKIEKEGLIHD